MYDKIPISAKTPPSIGDFVELNFETGQNGPFKVDSIRTSPQGYLILGLEERKLGTWAIHDTIEASRCFLLVPAQQPYDPTQMGDTEDDI